MALRRFLFQTLAVGSGYFDSSQDSDDLNLNSLAIKMASGTGTALDLNTNDVANVRKLILVTGASGVTIDGGNQRATNFATPTGTSDLATKAYVDSVASGLDWKQAVRVASVGSNVTVASAPASLDGVTLAANDRVLLKDQTAPAENGIYVFNGSGSALTRSTDGSAGQLTSGAAVFVSEGTTNADSGWTLTTNDPITVGTTSLAWAQFTGVGTLTAGGGLTKTGSQVDIGTGAGGTTCDGITIAADAIAVNIDTSAGLQFDASAPKKVQVKANTAAGIAVSASGVAITLNGTNPGLAFTSTYVDVKYGNGIQASASGVSIKTVGSAGTAGTAGGLVLSASGLALSLASSNPCLTVTSGLTVVCDGTTGATQVSASGIQVKLNGTTLSISASGLSVLGVPAAGTWQIGGSATSANVTAANLGTLTAGSASNADALHVHGAAGVSALGVTITAGAGGLSKGDPLYMSANGTCLKGDPSNNTKSVIIGIAAAAISAAANGIAQRDGVLAGAGAGWTYGQQIWMSNTGGLTNDPSTITSRYRTIQMGIALNATDLIVSIADYGVKP